MASYPPPDGYEEEYAVLAELTEQQTALAPLFQLCELPADQQPARVYLASLGNLDSQRTMRAALYDIVRIIIPEADSDEDEQPKRKRNREQMRAERVMREQIIYSFPWGRLRYQHTAIIRAKLDARYKFTTANRYLAALRMVLNHAMLLGQMSVDDYLRTKVVKNIRGTSLPKGRSLKPGEINDLINVCLDDERIHGSCSSRPGFAARSART
jgi:integrase/recombinase XerD